MVPSGTHDHAEKDLHANVVPSGTHDYVELQNGGFFLQNAVCLQPHGLTGPIPSSSGRSSSSSSRSSLQLAEFHKFEDV